jgi:hypothetical protein
MKLIYADVNKYDELGRIILTEGTWSNLEKHGIRIEQGLRLTFYQHDADDDGRRNDLIFDGTTQFDTKEQRWVAAIDWDNFKHASDFTAKELEQLGEE